MGNILSAATSADAQSPTRREVVADFAEHGTFFLLDESRIAFVTDGKVLTEEGRNTGWTGMVDHRLAEIRFFVQIKQAREPLPRTFAAGLQADLLSEDLALAVGAVFPRHREPEDSLDEDARVVAEDCLEIRVSTGRHE